MDRDMRPATFIREVQERSQRLEEQKSLSRSRSRARATTFCQDETSSNNMRFDDEKMNRTMGAGRGRGLI